MRRAIVLTGNEDVPSRVDEALGGEPEVVVARTIDAAYAALRDGIPALAVLEVTGETLAECDELVVGLVASPERPAVLLLAEAGARAAAGALVDRGAFGVLVLPLEMREARAVLRRALVHASLELERERAATEYESVRCLVQDIVANVPDGVLVVDGAGVVLEANDEAARILLDERRALLGSRLDPELGAPILELLKKARQSQGRAAGDMELRSGSHRLQVHGRAAIIRDEADRPVGGLVVLRASP